MTKTPTSHLDQPPTLPALEPNFCRFYIFRHGKSEGNIKKLIQGHKDFPLTPDGIEDARRATQLVQDEEFAEIFSSDLSRARQTAEIIASSKNLAVKATYLLRDKSFGSYDGTAKEKFKEEMRDQLAEHEALAIEDRIKHRLLPDMESEEDVISRLLTFMRYTAVANPGRKILVVSHSNVVRDLLVKFDYCQMSDLPSGSIKNCGYAVVDSDGVDFFVQGTYNIAFGPKKGEIVQD